MRPRRDKRRDDLWEEVRARMIAETSTWLTEALKHPEQNVHIPVIRADSGEFPASLARAFWDPLLAD